LRTPRSKTVVLPILLPLIGLTLAVLLVACSETTESGPAIGDERSVTAVVADSPNLNEGAITDPQSNTSTNRNAFVLPQRPGDPPSVTEGVPHIQQDQTSSDELIEALALWAFSLKGIEEEPTRASLPGARALTVSRDRQSRPEAMIIEREFAHIHPQPTGGSLHLRVGPYEAAEVVDTGWGEYHPFALNGSVPNLIMVYAPRDADDLDIVKTIVKAAADYATYGNVE
jgi:hypothetical protein